MRYRTPGSSFHTGPFRSVLSSFLLLFASAVSAAGQSLDSLQVLDMENLKRQPYLSAAGSVNCDSTEGSVPEYRICANLELQRQDSLLRERMVLVSSRLEENDEKNGLQSFLLGQKLWERYRFAHCSSVVSDAGSRIDMILFMECAARVTENRRRELEELFGE